MPKSPFELLAEHYEPNSKGFDPDNPLFKALWRYSPHHDPKEEYVRRSRAEAAAALLEIPAEIRIERRNTYVLCYVRITPASSDYSGQGFTALDALSAALLAKEGVKPEPALAHNHYCSDCPRCNGAGRCPEPSHAGICICGEPIPPGNGTLCPDCFHCLLCHSAETISVFREMEVTANV